MTEQTRIILSIGDEIYNTETGEICVVYFNGPATLRYKDKENVEYIMNDLDPWRPHKIRTEDKHAGKLVNSGNYFIE